MIENVFTYIMKVNYEETFKLILTAPFNFSNYYKFHTHYIECFNFSMHCDYFFNSL